MVRPGWLGTPRNAHGGWLRWKAEVFGDAKEA